MKTVFEPLGGVILGAMSRGCQALAGYFRRGKTAGFLSSYRRSEERLERSLLSGLISAAAGKSRAGFARRARQAISRQFEYSLILGKTADAVSRFLCMTSRQYGAFFLTFGAYATLIYLIKTLALSMASVAAADLWIGLLVVVASLPLLASQKTLASILDESTVTHALLIDAFGIPVERLRDRGAPSDGSLSVPVILGIIFGMLTYFVSPALFLTLIGAAAALFIIMAYPEAGVVMLIAIAPFIGLIDSPSITLAALTLLVFLSFTVKVIRGKRVLRFGVSDLSALLFWVVLLLGGFGSDAEDSLKTAVLMAALMLIYFLTVNLIRGALWMRACIAAVTASAFIIAFIGTAQYLLGFAPYDWIDTGVFPQITGRATSLFDNPSVLSAYLIMAFPAALSLTMRDHVRKIRVIGGIASAVILICVVFTWSRGAWIGLVIGTLFYLICRDPRFMLTIPPAAGAVALGCLVFPDTFGARIRNCVSLADSTNHYRVGIWHGVTRMLRDIWYCGTGAGENAFRSVYLNYAVAGIEAAPHAHSLWLQIAAQNGVVGLVVFLGVIFFAVRKCFADPFRKNGASLFFLAGAAALLIAGFFDYTWYNYRVFFIFWAMLGLSSADVDSARRERLRTEEPLESSEYSADAVIPFDDIAG